MSLQSCRAEADTTGTLAGWQLCADGALLQWFLGADDLWPLASDLRWQGGAAPVSGGLSPLQIGPAARSTIPV